MKDSYGREFTLKDVLYVPDLHVNLISLSKAHKAGVHYQRTAQGLQLSTDKLKLKSTIEDDLFVVQCSVAKSLAAKPASDDAGYGRSYAAVAKQVAAQLFHRRLGHTRMSTMEKMSSHGAVTGLPEHQFFKEELQSHTVCAPCAEGRLKRNSFPETNVQS